MVRWRWHVYGTVQPKSFSMYQFMYDHIRSWRWRVEISATASYNRQRMCSKRLAIFLAKSTHCTWIHSPHILVRHHTSCQLLLLFRTYIILGIKPKVGCVYPIHRSDGIKLSPYVLHWLSSNVLPSVELVRKDTIPRCILPLSFSPSFD